MDISEKIRARGEYVIVNDTTGEVVARKNVVVQNFFDAVLSYLNGTTTAAIGVTTLAVGTGTTTPTKNDTALAAQVFSKAITSKSITSSKFTCKTILAPAEAAVHIREIGIFAGSTLISRTLFDLDKNSATQYSVYWLLTIE